MRFASILAAVVLAACSSGDSGPGSEPLIGRPEGDLGYYETVIRGVHYRCLWVTADGGLGQWCERLGGEGE